MNVRDAAVQILREAGGPLHAQELTKRILAKNLWKTDGKTPAATVSARLYSDIKKNGESSSFVLKGSQIFGLRDAEGKAASPAAPVAATTKSTAKTYSFADAAERICPASAEP